MLRERTKPTFVVAALCLTALAPLHADARQGGHVGKARKAPPPPTADQQEVIAQVVADTFPRPKREPLTLALCLDVQPVAASADEDAPAPPPPQPRRGARKRAPEPQPLPTFHVLGAPPELVARLVRPWRVVASALACRLDPRQPIALADATHTPAQLVTVHVVPNVAAGSIKIDWTDSHDPTSANSRDCTAARGPHGWTVRCGGTWFQ